MIALLNGSLHTKDVDRLVVDVGGVGYEVLVSLQTFYKLPGVGEPVSLHIHTHAREDALLLFGFLEEKEKVFFLLLCSVSGIGPRLSLNILSGIPVEELEEAIRSRDVSRLRATPGVGKKTAERLVVELQERVTAGPDKGTVGTDASTPVSSEAVSALVNLGFRRTQAEKTVGDIIDSGKIAIADVIRESLRRLGT